MMMTSINWRQEFNMKQDKRPTSEIVAELKSYNWKKSTWERRNDIEILSEELGPGFTVKKWEFNKHLRVAVISDKGYQL